MDLLTACRDPNLFGPWFQGSDSWWSWHVFLKTLFGQPLELDEEVLLTRCTGRVSAPTVQASEAWLVCGRRSGKSFIISLIAVYLATFKNWKPFLAPGEKATIMIVACDKRQARVIMRYIEALLAIPLIAPMVEGKRSKLTEMSINLDNSVVIEVHTPSFRSVRGYSLCACLCDEIAFWRDAESANPDVEVLNAIRPALATVEGSMLLCASSPYARRGVLFDARRRYFAKDDPILIWQSDTRTMNPTVLERVIAEAEERDAEAAQSEWFARFRSDLESFVSREAVEACIDFGVREKPRFHFHQYQAFVDPSGGRNDSFTLAIGHREDETAVLDCLRDHRPPFDPQNVVQEMAATLKTYGVTTVQGDKYAGEWPISAFRKYGINYRSAAKPKSDLYKEMFPAINSRRVLLLDNQKLLAQLIGLERRTGRGGRDQVDHAPGSHDDLANAVAGLAGMLAKPRQRARRVALLGV